MRRTGVSKPTVRRRRDRFLALGVDGLLRDATRPPGKKPTPDGPGDVAAPAACPAPDGAGTGREAGDGLHGILKQSGLGPHRVGTFRASRDPGFGIRARDVATGKVVGRTVDRHRSQEFLAFPDPVAEGIAPGTPVHVIPDTVSSHGAAEVRTWPKGRPDRTFRFTPTPASRTDAVEGFFPRLSGQRLKDAVFDPLDECITAIEGCIAHHEAHHARPFRWSRKPEDLVEACKGGHRKLRENGTGCMKQDTRLQLRDERTAPVLAGRATCRQRGQVQAPSSAEPGVGDVMVRRCIEAQETATQRVRQGGGGNR